jgi:hypothetical protein
MPIINNPAMARLPAVFVIAKHMFHARYQVQNA